MRIALVTMCTAEVEAVGRLSRANRRAYCRRHGYDYVESEEVRDGRPAVWSKLPLLRGLLGRYDWLFWSDADSLVLRPEVPLTHFIGAGGADGAGGAGGAEAADLLITRDGHGCNAGQLLLSGRSGRAAGLLDAVYAQEQFVERPLAEQAALTHVIDEKLAPASVRYVPKTLLNAEVYDVTAQSFLVHFLGQPARVYLMRKWLRERPDLGGDAAGGTTAGGGTADAAGGSDGGRGRDVAEAAAWFQCGRVAEAEAVCRRLLARCAGHAAAAHLLGLVCRASGRGDEGFDLLCRSLDLSPGAPSFHNNLGAALAECGLADDAAECFCRALALRPHFPSAEANLRKLAAAPPPRRRPAPIPPAGAGPGGP